MRGAGVRDLETKSLCRICACVCVRKGVQQCSSSRQVTQLTQMYLLVLQPLGLLELCNAQLLLLHQAPVLQQQLGPTGLHGRQHGRGHAQRSGQALIDTKCTGRVQVSRARG